MRRARYGIATADKLLHSIAELADLAEPAGWGELAGQAALLRNEAENLLRVRATIYQLLAPAQPLQPSRGIGDVAQPGPELNL